MKNRIAILGIALISIFSTSSISFAAGNDLDLPVGYVQNQFKDLSKTIGLLAAYKPLAPAEPLGILGFDIGAEVTAVDVDEDASFLKDATADSDPPSFFLFPRLHAQKGLPFGIDVGVVYAKVQQSNIGLIGGEIKWALLKGTVATPALAIRGSYTSLTGVGDLDLETYGVDVSASKGFAFLTPYVGVGLVRIHSEVTDPVLAGFLTKEELTEVKGFAGLKVKLLLLSLVGEVEISEVPSYTFRLNFSF